MGDAAAELVPEDLGDSLGLEGPPAAVFHPEDATHWVAVYTELVGTIDRLLEDAKLTARASTEIRLLETRAAALRRRRDWWVKLQAGG